jgi:hypothetical protein
LAFNPSSKKLDNEEAIGLLQQHMEVANIDYRLVAGTACLGYTDAMPLNVGQYVPSRIISSQVFAPQILSSLSSPGITSFRKHSSSP